MGLGDKLMAIGDAWELHRSDHLNRRVAIGDGVQVDPTDANLTWGLDKFLADQAAVDAGEQVHWIRSFPSFRPYIDYSAMEEEARRRGLPPMKRRKLVNALGKFIWNHNYRAKPAKIALKSEEQTIAGSWRRKRPFILVEPYLKPKAPTSKQWPVERYLEAAQRLSQDVAVYQLRPNERKPLPGIDQIVCDSPRLALAYLKAASLYIGPEGFLHHGAAAMNTPAVVLFGGYIPPSVTGYMTHVNLTGGASACGVRDNCPHCAAAMHSIRVEDVTGWARHLLDGGVERP